MKTLLVPTDFSVNANNALKYAISFAKKENDVRIILLHVFNEMDLTADVPPQCLPCAMEELKNQAAESMSRLCEKVKKAGLKNGECIYVKGSVVDVILNVIREKDIDLVVMGTRGARGIKEIFIGSNTERVIKKTHCPVIVVPKKAVFKDIKNITYVTDYYNSNISTMIKLVKRAKLLNAQINVLNIYDEECMASEEKEFMKEFILKVRSKVNYKKISYQLIYGHYEELRLEEYMNATSSDLLVISKNYRTLYEKLFGKNITKKLPYHRNMPLMVFYDEPESKPIPITKNVFRFAPQHNFGKTAF